MAKNFPIVSGQRASRTAAIQSFRRTYSLRMTTPPVSCARQMQRTIWLDVCARSRSVLISVLLCPRSGITRAGERVSRRSVVIPRSSEGLATRAARKIDLQRCYTRPTYTLERCISAAQLPLPFMKFSAPHFSPPPSSFHVLPPSIFPKFLSRDEHSVGEIVVRARSGRATNI